MSCPHGLRDAGVGWGRGRRCGWRARKKKSCHQQTEVGPSHVTHARGTSEVAAILSSLENTVCILHRQIARFAVKVQGYSLPELHLTPTCPHGARRQRSPRRCPSLRLVARARRGRRRRAGRLVVTGRHHPP